MTDLTDQLNSIPSHLLNTLLRIVAQYTMSDSLHQNGIAERQNRTLKNMVKNMMTFSSLSKSLWSETLETVVYLWNRTSSKAVTKTPYKLWIGKKFSIRHLHV